AALDLAPQHARHFHVGAEIGPPGDLVDPVGADGAGAAGPQSVFFQIAPLCLLCSSLPPKQDPTVRAFWPPSTSASAGGCRLSVYCTIRSWPLTPPPALRRQGTEDFRRA